MNGQKNPYQKLSEELNVLDYSDHKAAALKAREIADKAEAAGEKGYAKFFLGEAFAFEKNYDEAIKLEKEAIDLLPNVSFIISNFATLLSNLNEDVEALKWLEKSLMMNPKDVLANYQKGVSLSKLGKSIEAIEFLNKAIELSPEYPGLISYKGLLLAKLGKVKEALEYCDKGIALYPKSAHSYNKKGLALYFLHDYDNSLHAFDDALNLDPNNAFSFKGKGVVYYKIKKFNDALKMFLQSKSISPWVADDFDWIVQIYSSLGDFDMAERTAKEWISILDKRKLPTQYAQFMLQHISQKKSKKAGKDQFETTLDDSMIRVLNHFKEDVNNFITVIENNKMKFKDFIDLSKKSTKIGMMAGCGFLSVLRKWNSLTPVMNIEVGESKGGGYFLYLDGKGIVIDPGFDFIRNFSQEGFKVADIDYIFISHAHIDHMADIESLFSLLYKANEKGGANTKIIELYMNLGAIKKLSGWLTFSEKYIKKIHILESGVPIQLGNIRVTPTYAKHNEILDDIYSLGFLFEYNGRKIGFSGDTGWVMDGSISKPFIECDVFVAHLGSFLAKEIDPKKTIQERLYTNHLGLLGMSAIINNVRPKLCVISEFGEELGDLRLKIADGLKNALGVKCIAADVGTEISFSNPPKIRCIICGKFFEDCLREIKDTNILYICKDCKISEYYDQKLNKYLEGERTSLWSPAGKS